MVDTRNFELLCDFGFEFKTDAQDMIQTCFSEVPGVTTYWDDESRMWYIVQSRLYIDDGK